MSESLRSLQNLLSESGRREPSLDDRQTAAGDSGGRSADDPRPGPLPPISAGSGTRTPPDRPHRDSAANPEEGSGNRWRDLNLTFDAEPAVPRARRNGDAESDEDTAEPDAGADAAGDSAETAGQFGPEAETEDTAGADEPGSESGDGEAAAVMEPGTQEPAAPTGSLSAPTGSPGDSARPGSEPEPDVISYDLGARPLPGVERGADDTAAPDNAAGHDESPDADREAAADYHTRPSPDDEVLVLDLDDPGPPPSGTPEPAPAPPDIDGESFAPGAEPDRGGADVEARTAAPGQAGDEDVAPVDADAPESPLSEPAVSDPLAIEPDSPEPAPDASPPGDADSAARDGEDDDAGDAPTDNTNEAAANNGAYGSGLEAAPETAPVIQPDIPGRTREEPASGDADAAMTDDEKEEDQLHLELEASEGIEGDIPVLTNAVYVPESPTEEAAAPPGPAESPHEARIGRCIEDLRVRLRLMGLDALSDEQERELHDALVELLDELDHG